MSSADLMVDLTGWAISLSPISQLLVPLPMAPVLAEAAEAEIGPLVLAGVLLSLITVFLAAKIGGEVCARINLPPV